MIKLTMKLNNICKIEKALYLKYENKYIIIT